MKLMASMSLALFFSFSLYAEIPYTAEALKKSQAKNEKILLQVHAPWCPVCKNEDKVFSKLKEEKYLKNITYYKADFDKEQDLKKSLNVMSPGTLILFHGNKEISRVPGVQTEEDFKRFAGDFVTK